MDSQQLNRATTITDEEVKEVMDYHPWDANQIDAGNTVRATIGAAFKAIVQHVPPCPDRSAALRKLRGVRMDANSAITHGGKF